MAHNKALWIIGGLTVLYLVGRQGGLGGLGASAAGYGAGAAGPSPAGGGFFTGLNNMIQNLGAGLPGLPSGAGQYNPVNYSPAQTMAPTGATGGLIPASYSPAGSPAASPYAGILAGTTPASTLSA